MRQTIPVGSPAAPALLASVDELRAALNLSQSDSTDAQLSGLLQDASDMALRYIGRSILDCAWRDTITFESSEKRLSLVLGRWPVTAITALSINGHSLSDEGIASIPLDPASGLIFPPDDAAPLWSGGRYVVNYQAGWTLDKTDSAGVLVAGTLPAAIRRAVIIAAVALWHASGRDPLLKSESEQGVGSTSWDTSASATGGMPQAAADILAAFRAVGVR
ncbi:hypothetical protein LWC05_05465 [Acetobacter sicerae]|uniref:Phage gp6-like head-tail connector protein n=1 Tax=Acetobacter sicerae TaxID=85325 RepID=A0ABS8VT67_9PROT|nr:hypothetical protein [Acetobacter sicerae]MCE0743339.1 hypothetical protein [Acetobacter sicerae]